MLQPDYKQFSRLAREATLIPVVKSVSADLLTPVSAFLAIADKEPHAFLLESVERGEQIGRYTFLGARPYMRVKARPGAVEIERGRKHEVVHEGIFQVVKRLLREHRPATVPGLPPFTAGAVGYFAYDVIRQLEKIGEHAKDDLKLPDAELMFFDRLLAFDHLRHQIHIVAAADVARESPRRAYDRALRDIAALEEQLAAGLSPALWQKSAKAKARKLKVHPGTKREDYLRTVERCKEYIAAGDIFQVVPSQRFDFVPDVAPFDLYRALRQVNPSPYLYFLRSGETHILGSSPEMLVRVTGRQLEYRPIAGTRPRGRDEAEDQRLEQQMRNDEKERAEHVMLVDLGRNDLGRVSEYGSVKVKDLMYVERYSHVMHLVSALEGTLRKVSAKSDLAGAMKYALVRWEALTRFRDDGRIELDNNSAERSIRPLVLGRRNYLFAGSDAGGERAAAIYSLIGTALLNGVEPYGYFRHVLERIAEHPINRVAELLPWQVQLASATQQLCA